MPRVHGHTLTGRERVSFVYNWRQSRRTTGNTLRSPNSVPNVSHSPSISSTVHSPPLDATYASCTPCGTRRRLTNLQSKFFIFIQFVLNRIDAFLIFASCCRRRHCRVYLYNMTVRMSICLNRTNGTTTKVANTLITTRLFIWASRIFCITCEV
jgi:hypothetical protein